MKRAEKLKSSPASGTSKIESEKKPNPSLRNPLKDLNSINSNSSSTSCSSQSIEVPRGCLRFFLPSSSKTPLHRPKSISKTPKSAPHPRPSKPRSKPLSKNPEKPISQNPQKAKKTTPSLNHWKNGKTPIFRASRSHPKPSSSLEKNNVNGYFLEILGSGSCLEDPSHKQKQQKWPITGETSELGLINFQNVNLEDSVNDTPVSKVAPGKVAMEENWTTITNANTTTTTTPPIQASISPEIQCGSSMASTTPACFAAGHVLVSGVTDRRKCRPRGILSVGEDLGFYKARVSDGSFADNDDAIGFIYNSGVSLVPAPAEASMHWLLSPCEEDKGSPLNVSPVSLTPFHPVSSLSSLEVSSDICGNCNTTTTSTISNRSTCLISPSEPPEFEGFVGLTPSEFKSISFFDHLASCSSSSPAPARAAASSCKALMSKEERGYRYELTVDNSPLSGYSVGSQNLICTPQSDSSSDRNVGFSWLKNAEDHQEYQFELDSLAGVIPTRNLSTMRQESMSEPADVLLLPGFSFQFMYPDTPSNSINQTQFQKIFNDRTLGFESLSQSKMRISWREGLVSRIFEMDELDCCRRSSDEEEDLRSSVNHDFKTDFHCELNQNMENDLALIDNFAFLKLVSKDPGIEEKCKVNLQPQRPSSCAEPISTEGGGLVASGDSDWTLCYKNKLFEI